MYIRFGIIAFRINSICILISVFYIILFHDACMYSGTSLIRSRMGLGKSDLNGEVTVLQGQHCTVEYNLGLIKSDPNGEVTLLVR